MPPWYAPLVVCPHGFLYRERRAFFGSTLGPSNPVVAVGVEIGLRLALISLLSLPAQAEVEQKKKRTFRKFTYRGVDLDQLLDMS